MPRRPRQPQRGRAAALPLALALLACGDDPLTTSERLLRIPEPIELCAVSAPWNITEPLPLFHHRAVLRLEAGEIALPAASGVEVEAWLPFTLRTGPDGPELTASEGAGAVSVAADSVPHAIYSLVDAAGWETVVYTDNPDAMTYSGDRLHVQLTYPSGTSDFELANIPELDRELRLKVIAFVPGLAPDDPVRRVRAAPCTLPDIKADRVDITFAEGAVSFHTRPAWWRGFDGFTVLAEGDVDGIPIEVDAYWDLEYRGSSAENWYAVSPLFAVRFDEQPDGACILVVQPDPFAPEETYLARLLDCQQNTLRDLTVESVTDVPGGGESRW